MAKPEKPENTLDRKIRKNRHHSLLTKTENQRLNWRKLANRARHQNRKTAVQENRETESKLGQIRKTENPNTTLTKRCGHVRSLRI